MALAPKFSDVQKQAKVTGDTMKEESISHGDANVELHALDLAPDGVAEFSTFGLGGCGKVATIRYAKSGKARGKITTIDTSGVQQKLSNVESLCIEGLRGSGKLRKENVEAIRNYTNDFVSNTQFSDVNLLVFSAAGGSGSVIGPVLLSEILRQGKIAIVITLVDQDSEVDCINSLNLLRTLDNIAKEKRAYIPTILFNNDAGRFTVDSGIDNSMLLITKLLSTPLIGLDTQDRLRFLNPLTFEGVTPGLKLLNLSTETTGDWIQNGQFTPNEDNSRIDAILIVSEQKAHFSPTKRCIVTFRGYYPEPDDVLIASIGYRIPADVVNMLNTTIHEHKSSVAVKDTVIKSEYDSIGTDSGGGLIL